MYPMRHRAGRHLLLATLLFITNLSYAQSGNQGSLEGTVADPSGAVIPAAHLKVTSHATGVVSETVSGPEVLYKFPFLPVGAYDLTVDSKGFANATFKNIEVAVGAKVNLPVSLRVSG